MLTPNSWWKTINSEAKLLEKEKKSTIEAAGSAYSPTLCLRKTGQSLSWKSWAPWSFASLFFFFNFPLLLPTLLSFTKIIYRNISMILLGSTVVEAALYFRRPFTLCSNMYKCEFKQVIRLHTPRSHPALLLVWWVPCARLSCHILICYLCSRC